jgi:hypothetical protein
MNIARRWACFGLPLLLAGCGGDDAAESAGEGTDTTALPVVTDTAPVAAAPPPPTGAAPIALVAVNNSGAGGEVVLSDASGQTQVDVRLTGAPPGERAGHIHSGTCDAPGAVVQPLQPVTVGADGTGTGTSTVPVALTAVTDGRHIVAFHGEGGAPIACAPIPSGA